MRILFVNTSEHTGGAAIAAHRLMKALNRNHVQVQMMVRDRETDSPQVVSSPSKWVAKGKFLAERLSIVCKNHFQTAHLFAIDPATFGTDITRTPEFRRADVIHLHWVNQGMLSLGNIRKILKSGKPVVWTLHDMWPCTGICHQAGSCERWLQGCGNCPLLWNNGAHNDLSRNVYTRKAVVYTQSPPIRFVACSNWLADIAKRAPLLKGHPVTSIPNPIDTRFYAPGEKMEARKRLGLPLEKKLLLFVAYRVTDKNKGIDYLMEATEHINNTHNELCHQLGIVLAGREADSLRDAFPCDAYPQNYVTDEQTMRDLYIASDLLVMPTLMDNLPNTIVEAMACGVPCVGFHVGGLPQMISHRKNGYLARYKDAENFAEGILETLFSENYRAISVAARRSAICNYSEDAVAERYIDLYEEALDACRDKSEPDKSSKKQ